MSFNCTCPYCKQLLQCEDAWAGMTAQCPTCGQNIVMNPPPAAPPPPPQTVQFSPFAGARPERASGGKILSVYLFMPLLLLFSPLSLILLIYLVVKGSWKNVRGHALASFLIWALLIPAILILLAVPAVKRAAEVSRMMNCVNNLKEINLGILMYADSHDGRLPRSLNDLSKYVSPQISVTWRCPDGGEYRYLGNGQSMDYRDEVSSTVVVICTSDHGPHGDRANAAFLDGHVETLPKRSIEDAVKKRKKGALPVLRY